MAYWLSRLLILLRGGDPEDFIDGKSAARRQLLKPAKRVPKHTWALRVLRILRVR